MRFLSYLTSLMMVVFLTACGGGGGSAGTSSGSAPSPVTPPAALFTTAPASLTIAVGAAQEYSISGGTPPYKVSSSNVQISIGGVKDSVMTIGGVAPGDATLTISDADAKTVSIAVIVANLSPLASTAPASVTIVKDTRRTYTISGGVPGYSVESSDNRIATATLSGTTLTINAVAIGSASIFVRDATGKTLTVAVTVSNSSTLDVFTTAPATINLSPLSSVKFDVGGGSPPYSIASTNPQTATANINGTVLTINSLSPVTSSSIITVQDANGKTATPINVTVTTPILQVSTTSVTGYVDDVLDVNVYGGVPPYRAVSSNDVGVSAIVPTDTSTVKITLKKVSSSIDVTVLDANNQSAKIAVTVINSTPQIRFSPSAVTVSENDTQPILFTVFGSSAGVLNVFSSDTTLLLATVANKTVTVITGSNGSRCVSTTTPVTITVVDSTRAVGVATVTIQNNLAGCGTLAVSPSSVTLSSTITATNVNVSGGTGSYTVLSSNPAVATAVVTGNVVTVTRVAASTDPVNITVSDQSGSATITVTSN